MTEEIATPCKVRLAMMVKTGFPRLRNLNNLKVTAGSSATGMTVKKRDGYN
jgi:hypothetical protein